MKKVVLTFEVKEETEAAEYQLKLLVYQLLEEFYRRGRYRDFIEMAKEENE